ALELFKENEFKLELINEMPKGEVISVYKQGKFVDLCRGPHVPHTGMLKAFKLTKIAGAYWKGDPDKKQLQRIYGISFPDKKELRIYLQKLEEAEKRSHLKLGKDLDLFSVQPEVGAGLAIWHPNGSIVRGIIEDFWKDEHAKKGYQYIYTPHIGRLELWKKSCHWDFYRENMYPPMKIENMEYLIKPMNCPFHLQVYKSKTRSYRDLPIRYCELGAVYRFELSGTLHGLTRVRGFTQDDAHIFCEFGQLSDEIIGVMDLAFFLLRSLGFKEFKVDFSIRDPAKKEKYLGSDEVWKKAEAALKKALETRKIDYKVAEGEAVFYGPKIDIKLVDALGREWQGPTIQVDFNFPEKFDLVYEGKDGKKHRPVMIHRTVLGSMERLMGCLIEHHAGKFPLWLSPVQVRILTVADRHNKYAEEIKKKFLDKGIRIELDTRAESIPKKVREAQLAKINYILVVGDKELKDKTVNVRTRDNVVKGAAKVDKFLAQLLEEIDKKC
ncbi:threonine--tRNA ligase, partial [Candidatus Woesearchaeota archaeon]|nr:threonine--tRNA ligase [Candidatus Woesearchaeota archaeon]